MKCPRRVEGPFHLPDEDSYRSDDTCSYCGSLNPDTFMARIESGDVELGPTDKSYKVYLDNKGGQKFKQGYRKDCDCEFPKGISHEEVMKRVWGCPHWTVEERDHSKFYFQHLSTEQQKRFIELHNDGKLKIGVPGHFYARPFFCRAELPPKISQETK